MWICQKKKSWFVAFFGNGDDDKNDNHISSGSKLIATWSENTRCHGLTIFENERLIQISWSSFYSKIQNVRKFFSNVFGKFWKSSPGSSVQDFKLDLVIFDGMDEFFSKTWDTCHICSKTWISHFYNQNFAFRSKISLW